MMTGGVVLTAVYDAAFVDVLDCTHDCAYKMSRISARGRMSVIT